MPDNLEVIGRIAGLKGLRDQVSFHLIGDDLSFEGLPDYDVIWVFGSIHHVPFEVARREGQEALLHLKPGGRWMELVYPFERWQREGELPFDQWGKLTDGPRTPWAEWHDAEKIRSRLAPAPFKTVLDFEFCSHNYRWVDLQYLGDRPLTAADFASQPGLKIDLVASTGLQLERGRRHLLAATKWSCICPPGFFLPAGRVDLVPELPKLDARDVAIDIEVRVVRGALGVGLVDGKGNYLPTAQAILHAGADLQRATLRSGGHGLPDALVFNGMDARHRSAFAVLSAVLRADGQG